MNIKACAQLCRENGDSKAQFKTALQILIEDMRWTRNRTTVPQQNKLSWILHLQQKRSVFEQAKIVQVESKTLCHCPPHTLEHIVIQCCWFAEFGSYDWPLHCIWSTKPGAQIWIKGKLVLSFLIQHMKALQLHFNWLWIEHWSMAKHYSLIASDGWSNVHRQHKTTFSLLVRRVWWWPSLYGWGTGTLEVRAGLPGSPGVTFQQVAGCWFCQG